MKRRIYSIQEQECGTAEKMPASTLLCCKSSVPCKINKYQDLAIVKIRELVLYSTTGGNRVFQS
jgi:hypothetical protein